MVREFVGTAPAELRDEAPNYGHQGRGPRLVPGMTIAIEPMGFCQYDCKITQAKRRLDGQDQGRRSGASSTRTRS